MKDSSASVPQLDKGTISFEQLAKDTNDRFIKNENLIYAVLLVVALTLVSIVIGCAALVLDQLHFNNEVYRDGIYNHTKTIVETKAETIQEKKPLFLR